jgi:hypothetical protein
MRAWQRAAEREIDEISRQAEAAILYEAIRRMPDPYSDEALRRTVPGGRPYR